MIEHIMSVICQSASIDRETGSISIFNVLESITVHANPDPKLTLHLPFEVFSLWTRSETDSPACGVMRVMFCDPEDSCETKVELKLDLKDKLFFRSRVRSEGFSLKGPGKYKIIVELKKRGTGKMGTSGSYSNTFPF